MMKLYRLEDLTPGQVLNRDLRAEQDVEAVVDAIIADVRARGDAALRDYARKFDGAELDALEVSRQELDEALDAADPGTLPADTVSTGDGGVQAELTLESGDTLRLAAEPAGEGWRITRWQLTAPWEPDTSLDVWTGQ